MAATTRLVTALIATLVPVFLAPAIAAACSCAQTTTAEQAAGADLLARVTVERVSVPDASAADGQLAMYTMRPTYVWKGDVVSQFKVSSEPSGASCGLEGIEEGQDLVVFAQEDEDGWTANLCGGTTVASESLVAELLDVVGPGVAVDAEPGDMPGEWVWPTVTAVTGVAVIAGLLLWMWRHPRGRV